MVRMPKVLLGILSILCSMKCGRSLPHAESGNVGGVELHHNGAIYLFSEQRVPAVEAALYCRRYGGNLAQIDMDAELFMRQTVARTPNREFWFGAFRLSADSAITTLATDPAAFVDCSTPSEFCQTNVAGPHLDETAHQGTCLATDTCDGTSTVATQPGGHENWAVSEPSQQHACSAISFRHCHLASGCTESDWSMRSCLETRNFVCMKSSCPDPSTVPVSASSSVLPAQYATYLGAKLHCDGNGTAFTINYCARRGINAAGIKVGDTGEEKCEMRGQVLVLPDLLSCNANITNGHDSVDFGYKLTFRAQFDYGPSRVVQRHRDVTIDMTCAVNNHASVDAGVLAARTSLEFEVYKFGYLDVTMFAFNDSSFSAPAHRLIVQVPDPVFIGLRVYESNQETYVVQLVECLAYEGCFCSGEAIYLVTDGCSDDPSTVAVIEDRNSSTARFVFSSFLWASNPTDVHQIYVSCFVNVCDRTVPGNNCTNQPFCPPFERKKRDLGPGESVHELRSDLITIVPPKSCAHKNGGCSHYCSDTDVGKVVCSCPSQMRLMEDQQTCYVSMDEAGAGDTEAAAQQQEESGTSLLDDFSTDISVLLLAASGFICLLSAYTFYEANHRKLSL